MLTQEADAYDNKPLLITPKVQKQRQMVLTEEEAEQVEKQRGEVEGATQGSTASPRCKPKPLFG